MSLCLTDLYTAYKINNDPFNKQLPGKEQLDVKINELPIVQRTPSAK